MMTGAPTRIPVSCGAFVSFHPSMGSVVSAERGAPHNLPPYFSLPSITRSGGPNFLGARHAPFVVSDDPNSKSFRVRDVTVPKGLDDGRIGNRRQVRDKLDQLARFQDRASGDPVLGADQNYQQAVSLMTSDVALRAFEIERETDAIRDAYGRNTLGQQALLARRLVEAGVRFIEVEDDQNWDTHNDQIKSMRLMTPSVDQTMAALLGDLHQRGLLASTLVVMATEFGRTPQISTVTAGRGHHPGVFTWWLAGSGVKGGYVHGQSDAIGEHVAENPVTMPDLNATVAMALGMDISHIEHSPSGRPFTVADKGRPVTALFT
jgi:hypothetical protein